MWRRSESWSRIAIPLRSSQGPRALTESMRDDLRVVLIGFVTSGGLLGLPSEKAGVKPLRGDAKSRRAQRLSVAYEPSSALDSSHEQGAWNPS